jgi:hypothetical protein
MIKNKFKSLAAIPMLLLILMICFIGLTGCDENKEPEIEQIYVTNKNTPRLTYVEGQELDLNGGILTVVKGGQETPVPLTDASVSVTGYDKAQTGDQTITVTYSGFSTTLTVKVIPRIVVEGYERQYFIGDPFQTSKGKLRIAKDDATTFTVNLNDPKVTIQSFDSSTEGVKTVSVQYKNGDEQYTCTFDVEIFGATDVKIVYPDKKQYYSHDTALDFAGGYLTVTTGTNGSIVRHVDITPEMASGFDISAVTKDHRTTPLSQEITIKYLDKTFKYTIKITYSGVTVINELMKTLKDVNLDGETITLTDAQASAAVEAITEYYQLTNRHKQLIAEADLHRLVRCAVGKVNELYLKAIEEETTLTIANGGISFSADQYQDIEKDIATLNDEKHLINVYATILRNITTDFPDLELTGDKKVAETIVVIAEEVQGNIIDAFKHIVELHKLMSVAESGEQFPAVPTEWTVDALKAYEPTILEVVKLIKKEPFMQNGLSGIYNLLSKWREKQDFFDIIYSYYLNSDNEEYTEQYIKENVLAKLPLPSVLSQWYSYWYNANYIARLLSSNGTKLYLRDVTEYMYYYDLLLEKTQEILNNETDKLSKDLLNLLEYDTYLVSARASYCGYYYHANILAGRESFEMLWDSYLEIYKLYKSGALTDKDGKFIIGENADKFDAVMAKISALSPSELYGFLSSLNFLYGNTNNPDLVLSKYKDESYLNALTLLLHAYYIQELGTTTFPAFTKLMEAMENFALLGNKDTALADFKAAFAELNQILDGLNATNKQKFFDHFETAYAKYLEIYNASIAADNLVLGADQDRLFKNFADCLNKIMTLYNYINNVEPNADGNIELKSGTYALLFALYEQADSYYNAILALDKTDPARMALYLKEFTINEKSLTLEKAHLMAGKIFASYMTAIPLTLTSENGTTKSYPAYEIYLSTKLSGYLSIAADLLYAQYYNDFTGITKDYVLSVIDAFHATDLRGVSFLRVFQGTDLHFDALKAYFEAALGTDAETVALMNKLIEAGNLYLQYAMKTSDEELKNSFLAAMEEATALKNALTNTENYTQYLEKLYTEYLEAYNEIKNPPATEG